MKKEKYEIPIQLIDALKLPKKNMSEAVFYSVFYNLLHIETPVSLITAAFKRQKSTRLNFLNVREEAGEPARLYSRPRRMLMCRLPLITVQPLRDCAASTESMTFSSQTLSQRPSQAVQNMLGTDRRR